MFRIDVIAVGTRPPAWIQAGVEEYVSRMHRECQLDIREVKTSGRNSRQSVDAHREAEAEMIMQTLNPDAHVVALDARGQNWSTEKLAANILDWSQHGNRFQFVIGGPDGLATNLLDRADDLWSLSTLTFPHFLVRIILVEQIYRALMLNLNHPYHR